MLKEIGLVTKIENNIAWVNTQSKLACSSCQVSSTCGNGILEKYLAGKIFISKIDNEIGAKVGDEVIIEIPKSSVTKASLLIYGIPLFSLMLGAFLGELLFTSELMSIFLSIVCMALGLFAIHLYNRKLASSEIFVPKMVAKKNTQFEVSSFQSIKIKNIE
jgi:sigma-E factor negative regulatory protein RseC